MNGANIGAQKNFIHLNALFLLPLSFNLNDVDYLISKQQKKQEAGQYFYLQHFNY